MAEIIHVMGAGTDEIEGKYYGWLSVGIHEPIQGRPEVPNMKVAKVSASPGIEKGFEGPGDYQVDGPFAFTTNAYKKTVLAMKPQILRKVKA